MHSTVVVLLSLCCIGWSRDITLGSNEGRKIFDEVRQANPAIWRQYENVTVIAPENELIGKVVVTDMRPEKDGDVQIVDGGDGNKSVTIELKSPTVLRGYEFHIEVYSVPDTIATDGEENLSKEDVTSTQSNENEEDSDSEIKEITQDKSTEKTTELPDAATSKDVKNIEEGDLSTVVEGDVNTNIRPSRETDENTSQTNMPEDKTMTMLYEASSSESGESEAATTTEMPETPEEPILQEANPDNTDSVRPARETVLHTSVIASETPVTDSAASEVTTSETASTTTATDETGEAKDATTTEGVVTSSQRLASFEYTTYTPIPYESVKVTPDYPSLSILDYIKSRESMRPIRRTEEENYEDHKETTQSAETDKTIDETTPLSEETSSIKGDDDTVDLVPPKEDASFNTDFTDMETTSNPIEGSTLNNGPRAGRGINFDANITEETTTTLDETEETTPKNTDEANPTPASVDATTPTIDGDITTPTSEDHTEISLEEQARNARGAAVDNDVNISEETQPTALPTEDMPSEDVSVKQANVIIVNMDELMAKDGNRKFVYTIPIVLVINSENRFPIIKIIAEDASLEHDEGSRLSQMQPSDESLDPNEYDYKGTENYRVEKTSDDY